jgi:uncharacterized membrane protein
MPVVWLCSWVYGAVVLTVVYATGERAPRFTVIRLAVVSIGLLLVTVPVPLLIYYGLQPGRQLLAVVGALHPWSDRDRGRCAR